MDQEQDDRRPDLSDEQPSKKQRLNPPPPLNPNQVNQRMVDFEQGNIINGEEQQQAGRKRKRRTRKASKKSRKSRRKSRRYRR
jgi:hypothetical protein